VKRDPVLSDASFSIERIGLRTPVIDDLYHLLRGTTWPRLLGAIVLGWLLLNAAFASVYLALGDAIDGARPGSWVDAFFFSVQTISTIGYGGLSPATPAADAVVVAESVAGLLMTALATGMIFAKFATPRARVLWPHDLVVCPHDGRKSLMIRLGNARTSTIVEARLNVALTLDDVTAEGVPFRRIHDLRLRRQQSPLFSLTWTAIHVIDDDSPLSRLTPEDLQAKGAMFILTLQGIEEMLAVTVHDRAIYPAARVQFGKRYVDILVDTPDGGRAIDYRRFHDLVDAPL
jgi:inward rectifier potassium channel